MLAGKYGWKTIKGPKEKTPQFSQYVVHLAGPWTCWLFLVARTFKALGKESRFFKDKLGIFAQSVTGSLICIKKNIIKMKKLFNIFSACSKLSLQWCLASGFQVIGVLLGTSFYSTLYCFLWREQQRQIHRLCHIYDEALCSVL